jgi:ketosteroid isomerase-like protein
MYTPYSDGDGDPRHAKQLKKGSHFMHKIIIALAVTALVAGPAAASEKSDVMETVHQWVDAFNKRDTQMSLATCADQTSIIDDIPPYEWHGAGACSKWISDWEVNAKKNDLTDAKVTLKKLRYIEITGDHAYVVVPANITYRQKGKQVKEPGGRVTLILQRGDVSWRIIGWSWAD